MKKKLDCTNLQCPEPVLKTKALLETHALQEIEICVDNDAAVENVSRFLDFNGFQVSVDSDGIVSTVSGSRSKKDTHPPQTTPKHDAAHDTSSRQKILVMISTLTIGKGDDDLGKKLMASFLTTLKEMGPDLWRLVFVNHGVILCTLNSDLLNALEKLESEGVDILVCGTCLTHLALLDKKKVGQTTNMLDIVSSMQLADKVISL
jgi:selenium metabolism protein YedF